MRRTLLVAAVLLLAVPGAAQAAFPGQNGKIAFMRWAGNDRCLYTANPDGSGEAPLLPCETYFRSGHSPRWSADGQWVAFNGYYDEIDLVRANGTDYTPWVYDSGGITQGFSFSPEAGTSPYAAAFWVVQHDGDEFGIDVSCAGCAHLRTQDYYSSPDWSPDGQVIAFSTTSSGVEVMQPDGQGRTALAQGGQPSWSPDGQQIAFTSYGDGNSEIYVMQPDGTGQTRLTTNPASDTQPRWSPDGSKIVFESDRDGPTSIYVMDADGTNQTAVITNAAEPDWQPILRGYPRPKGAGTDHYPLVPAYQPCTSPNRAHAAPLSFASCNPPTQASTQLTLGTPDANLKPAASVASLRIGVIPGTAGPPDDAEVNLITSVTDVRNASDLSDYTGNLEMRVPLRITDKSNTPYPGGPGPGTAQDFTFTWNVPCTATPDPNIGADCSLFTTADTLLPGSALEGRRAIWQTDQIDVRDGAGQPFLRQGVFVP